MAVQQDFSFVREEDTLLNVSFPNSIDLTGWNLQFKMSNRFGSESGLVIKSAGPGFYNGVSGITLPIPSSPMFSVKIKSVDTSGFDSKNYSFEISRTDPGFKTALTCGYILLLPDINP